MYHISVSQFLCGVPARERHNVLDISGGSGFHLLGTLSAEGCSCKLLAANTPSSYGMGKEDLSGTSTVTIALLYFHKMYIMLVIEFYCHFCYCN